jgi:hypothetical protein
VIVRTAVGLLLVAAVGTGAFFGTRAVADRFFAETEEEPAPVVVPQLQAIEDEKLEPRFEGEIGGVYVARSEDGVPDEYVTIRDVCPPDSSSVDTPFSKAGALDLEVELPSGYLLQTNDPNTGAVECNGVITTARRHYFFKASTGALADVIVGRAIGNTFCCWDVAERRVKEAEFGGRAAVLIEPVTEDAVSQQSGIVFLEEGYRTSIRAANLPLTDLKMLAEIVARALAE